jgi:hypothetical protein
MKNEYKSFSPLYPIGSQGNLPFSPVFLHSFCTLGTVKALVSLYIPAYIALIWIASAIRFGPQKTRIVPRLSFDGDIIY